MASSAVVLNDSIAAMIYSVGLHHIQVIHREPASQGQNYALPG